MDVQITEMTAADYDEVFVFWEDQPGVGLNESDGRGEIGDYLKRNGGMSFVAREDGKVIGAILGGHDGRRGYLHHLAVAAAYRGRGIGKALVQRCLEQLGRAGITKCNVFSFEDNAIGQGFWKAVGFSGRSDLKLMQRYFGDDIRPGAGKIG